MSEAPIVRLKQKGVEYELLEGHEGIEVSEGTVLGFVEAQSKPTLEFDDHPLPTSWNARGQVAVWTADLTNQVGFHRLKVTIAGKSYLYDFKTHTAKAAWNEIQVMAEFCANSYFGYRRQFAYMARTGAKRSVRLPQVEFGWLRDRIIEIEQLVSSINTRPASRRLSSYQMSRCGQNISVPHTIRLLRERKEMLELGESGPIEVDRATYWPSRVVVSKKEQSSKLEEHAQIANFLRYLATGCQDLARVVDSSIRNDVEQFLARIQLVQSLPVFRGVTPRSSAKGQSTFPTVIQRTDRRYFRLREIQAEYAAEIFNSDCYAKSVRANVRDVWEIYQTFVAHVVGNSLGLMYFSDDMDLRKRSSDGWSMASEHWHLYFDTAIPSRVLHSWRDGTRRPSNLRPDIVLVGITSGRVVLLDAKFKSDFANARATSEDLFEMQGYLNGYSTSRGGILFPGKNAGANIIAGNGNALVELPIRASYFANEGGSSAVHKYVRDAIESLVAT